MAHLLAAHMSSVQVAAAAAQQGEGVVSGGDGRRFATQTCAEVAVSHAPLGQNEVRPAGSPPATLAEVSLRQFGDDPGALPAGSGASAALRRAFAAQAGLVASRDPQASAISYLEQRTLDKRISKALEPSMECAARADFTLCRRGHDGHGGATAPACVEGLNLRDWCAQHQPDWREVSTVMLRVGRAVAAAHASGRLAGRFDPALVRIDDSGHPYFLQAPASRPIRSEEGTAEADVHADVFRFCVCFFEGLFGRSPGQALSSAQLAAISDAPTLASGTHLGVPRKLTATLLQGMAFDRHIRPRDLGKFCDAIELVCQRAQRRGLMRWFL